MKKHDFLKIDKLSYLFLQMNSSYIYIYIGWYQANWATFLLIAWNTNKKPMYDI